VDADLGRHGALGTVELPTVRRGRVAVAEAPGIQAPQSSFVGLDVHSGAAARVLSEAAVGYFGLDDSETPSHLCLKATTKHFDRK